ncbi:hypothetical protein B0H16DRAFT_1723307 [Mycena metata]|uniref:Uncharacterized protein n=1 Tax=Mycena metata TaxID=1033252 RepID=A0AAD7IYN0_9AGAR|nr:hypothetical protein B0H16DRAFT_1723307 [Mycena metata]
MSSSTLTPVRYSRPWAGVYFRSACQYTSCAYPGSPIPPQCLPLYHLESSIAAIEARLDMITSILDCIEARQTAPSLAPIPSAPPFPSHMRVLPPPGSKSLLRPGPEEHDEDGHSATSRTNGDAAPDPPADDDDNPSMSSKADAGTEARTMSDYEGSEGSPGKPSKSAKTPPTKKRPSQVRVKAQPAASGRDLGLTKANSSRSVAAAKRKPPRALERLSDFRESELTRMGEKRKLQHTEEMEHMKIKRMKYEVKLLTAQNEQVRLNRYATSQSPRRGTRVLNRTPSPSKSRARYDSALSPRPVRSHTPHHPSSVLSRPAFEGGTDLFSGLSQSGMGEGSSSMVGSGSSSGFDFSTMNFTSMTPGIGDDGQY